jgi:glycosyltransferase involved in cell wall biosynthesis
MKEQLVSVIIPVYNCEKYLAAAIRSAMDQTYRPMEILVVDDGSTDGTADVARTFGESIRYDANVHQGIAAIRNRGVNLAQGDFLAFLDSDDLWVEDKIERQVKILNQHPEFDMVFTCVQQFFSPELGEEIKTRIKVTEEIMKGVYPCSCLIRKESFLRAGPFDVEWRVGEFIDWYLKATEAGLRSLTLPDVLTKRRIHNDNTSTRDRKSQQDFVRILKASLDRRKTRENSSNES